MSEWTCAMSLNERREVVFGCIEELAAAVKRGADLRSYTTFEYGEHMAVPGSDEGLVEEMMSFGVTYCLEGGHVAGIQTTRYPANAGLGFGDMPSLSFFLNNENGLNGIARLFLDGRKGATKKQSYASGKYTTLDMWDDETSAPSENFTYDFGEYAWWVDDSWQEVLSHDADGTVLLGSLDELEGAFRRGCRLKVGVRDLCADLAAPGEESIPHEVFVELHSIYNHKTSGFLGGESQPIVRVAPGVPLKYKSGNWDCGWILPRTDGIASQVIVDPYNREFTLRKDRSAMRWFVRKTS